VGDGAVSTWSATSRAGRTAAPNMLLQLMPLLVLLLLSTEPSLADDSADSRLPPAAAALPLRRWRWARWWW